MAMIREAVLLVRILSLRRKRCIDALVGGDLFVLGRMELQIDFVLLAANFSPDASQMMYDPPPAAFRASKPASCGSGSRSSP